MTAKKTTALGPYNRYVIWVQGCNKNCAGCISIDSRPLDGGYGISIYDLVDDIINTSEIEGITISGGEPYLQSEALVRLILEIKKIKDLGIILYTGFNFSEIEENVLTNLCDLIIDGEYIEELNDDLSLRGSSNQRLWFISDRYKDEAPKAYGVKGRKVEIQINNERTSMIGIPGKEFLKAIEHDKGGKK